LKSERTTAARSMRAVALAITLVSVVTFAAVGYSAYSDFNGFISNFRTGSTGISARTVAQGQAATLYVNATVPNDGLFPLSVSISCTAPPAGVTCTSSSLTIPPSTSGVLRFQISIANVTELQNAAGLHLNGTAVAGLVPFASISITVDLGSFLTGGGS